MVLGRTTPLPIWSFLPWFVRPSRLGPVRSLLFGISLGFSISASLTGIALYALDSWKRGLRRKAERRLIELRENEVVGGVEGLIGNTALVRVNSLSDAMGCEILGKCEFLNPFGSVKDRVSLRIIKEAEKAGLLYPHTGSCIFEGTSGSTGISIAGIARARGYKAHIVLPDDVAKEKVQLLEALGAEVEKVRPVSIVDKRHYVNLARQRALEFGRTTITSETPSASVAPSASPSLLIRSQSLPSTAMADEFVDPPRGLFADQFENESNFLAHLEGTGPEIWQQTEGVVDAFVAGAGTGGTIAGVAQCLKGHRDSVEIVLADPQGSGLYHKIHDGVMYSPAEREGRRRRHQVDTVVEGIGLNRLTANFARALPLVSDAVKVTDEEAVAMSRHVARQDGLFLGSSSAVNLVACVRVAQRWGKGSGKTVVTILCDSGTRHHSRFWNDDYLAKEGIPVRSGVDFILNPVKASA